MAVLSQSQLPRVCVGISPNPSSPTGLCLREEVPAPGPAHPQPARLLQAQHSPSRRASSRPLTEWDGAQSAAAPSSQPTAPLHRLHGVGRQRHRERQGGPGAGSPPPTRRTARCNQRERSRLCFKATSLPQSLPSHHQPPLLSPSQGTAAQDCWDGHSAARAWIQGSPIPGTQHLSYSCPITLGTAKRCSWGLHGCTGPTTQPKYHLPHPLHLHTVDRKQSRRGSAAAAPAQPHPCQGAEQHGQSKPSSHTGTPPPLTHTNPESPQVLQKTAAHLPRQEAQAQRPGHQPQATSYSDTTLSPTAQGRATARPTVALPVSTAPGSSPALDHRMVPQQWLPDGPWGGTGRCGCTEGPMWQQQAGPRAGSSRRGAALAQRAAAAPRPRPALCWGGAGCEPPSTEGRQDRSQRAGIRGSRTGSRCMGGCELLPGSNPSASQHPAPSPAAVRADKSHPHHL